MRDIKKRSWTKVILSWFGILFVPILLLSAIFLTLIYFWVISRTPMNHIEFLGYMNELRCNMSFKFYSYTMYVIEIYLFIVSVFFLIFNKMKVSCIKCIGFKKIQINTMFKYLFMGIGFTALLCVLILEEEYFVTAFMNMINMIFIGGIFSERIFSFNNLSWMYWLCDVILFPFAVSIIFFAKMYNQAKLKTNHKKASLIIAIFYTGFLFIYHKIFSMSHFIEINSFLLLFYLLFMSVFYIYLYEKTSNIWIIIIIHIINASLIPMTDIFYHKFYVSLMMLLFIISIVLVIIEAVKLSFKLKK